MSAAYDQGQIAGANAKTEQVRQAIDRTYRLLETLGIQPNQINLLEEVLAETVFTFTPGYDCTCEFGEKCQHGSTV